MNDRPYTAYVSGIAGDEGPGFMSVAYLLISPLGIELDCSFHNTSTWGSPHDAEYTAVLSLLRSIQDRPEIESLTILTCNTLVVNQVTGKWRTHVDRHKDFCSQIITKCKDRFQSVTVSYVKKAENLIKAWHWERHKEVRQAQIEDAG